MHVKSQFTTFNAISNAQLKQIIMIDSIKDTFLIPLLSIAFEYFVTGRDVEE